VLFAIQYSLLLFIVLSVITYINHEHQPSKLCFFKLQSREKLLQQKIRPCSRLSSTRNCGRWQRIKISLELLKLTSANRCRAVGGASQHRNHKGAWIRRRAAVVPKAIVVNFEHVLTRRLRAVGLITLGLFGYQSPVAINADTARFFFFVIIIIISSSSSRRLAGAAVNNASYFARCVRIHVHDVQCGFAFGHTMCIAPQLTA